MKHLTIAPLVTLVFTVSGSKTEHSIYKSFSADTCLSKPLFYLERCRPSQIDLDSDAGNALSSFDSIQATGVARRLVENVANFPWSFWPACYPNQNSNASTCVFSNQKFANKRGISIVTSLDIATEISKKLASSHPDALRQENSARNIPFVEQEIPGKGRGLVANTTLHRGDQIFASTPLLIVEEKSYLLMENEMRRLLHRAVEMLPKESEALFWRLLGHLEGDPVEDRINTNSFGVYVNGIAHKAVFPEIAMTNHDCRPNAMYFWDQETWTMYVHAAQTIYPGQEITITYIDNEMSHSERVNRLRASWNFDCSCSACSARPSIANESDARLRQIDDLMEMLDDWSSDTQATPEAAEALLSLYEQERLFASLGAPYQRAAEVYSSYGDKFNAARYARLCIDYRFLYRGFDDRVIEEMRAMAKDPEISWSWKKRMGLDRSRGCSRVH